MTPRQVDRKLWRDFRGACALKADKEKKARMTYQMQRLVEGMGGGQGDQEERLLEQVNEFIAMRPTGGWVVQFCGCV